MNAAREQPLGEERPDARWRLGDQDAQRLLAESKQFRGESLWQDAWRRLRKSRASSGSLLFLLLFGLTSFLAPLLPLPSPKALTLQLEPTPPDWPWGPAREYEDAQEQPGERPTIEKRAFLNNGWRHRATIGVRAPEGTPGGAITGVVAEVTGRGSSYEARPADEGGDVLHYVTVPLRADDAPRVDFTETGLEGSVAAWRVEVEPGAFEVHYDLNVDREHAEVVRWSVEQRTRRGKLHVVTETDHYRYAFTLDQQLEGKPSTLVLNGEPFPIDGAGTPEGDSTGAPGGAYGPLRKRGMQVARAVESEGTRHSDLAARVAAALDEAGPAGAALEGVRIEDGYWELGRLDRALVHLRGRLFGPWQTGNWLGTDSKGQDLLSRIVWGSRTSILVALAATLCSLVIGVLYGAFSGLKGGRIDNFMMRIIDILYSVPFIFVVIFLITVVNEYRTELEDVYGIDREVIFFVVIGAIYWLTMARVVRGQVLSLKNSEFIEAARVLGASTWRILIAHLVPNVLSIVIVYLTLTIPAIMLFEAFLSYLGLGIEPPKVSWGTLAVESLEAVNRVHVYWWLVLFPALAMGATLLALNILGDGLRDALDPKLRGKD